LQSLDPKSETGRSNKIILSVRCNLIWFRLHGILISSLPNKFI